jgi:hypothetical protein
MRRLFLLLLGPLIAVVAWSAPPPKVVLLEAHDLQDKPLAGARFSHSITNTPRSLETALRG